jgi:hypothetical protein
MPQTSSVVPLIFLVLVVVLNIVFAAYALI